jgi:hypothetical protein
MVLNAHHLSFLSCGSRHCFRGIIPARLVPKMMNEGRCPCRVSIFFSRKSSGYNYQVLREPKKSNSLPTDIQLDGSPGSFVSK